MLGCFGCFLTEDELRAKIFKIIAGGEIFKGEVGREKVVRGVIAQYDNYSEDLQKKILKQLATYLKTVDDEKTNYSKKIAEFVLEKGGTVPDRSYWEYNTAWNPFFGSESFLPERKNTQKRVRVKKSDLCEKGLQTSKNQ
jgi:hypothetical protein